MRRMHLALLILLGSCLLSQHTKANERSNDIKIFVSPEGSDDADGLRPEPNPLGRDGPLRTIQKAVTLVRGLKAHQTEVRARAITVFLRGGRYELEGPLAFGPEDSGSPDTPIIYRSYPGEIARIEGGLRLKGWQLGHDGVWLVKYPFSLSPAGCPRQLFVGGERRYRPRLPATGTLKIESVPKDSPPPNDRFVARQGDLPAQPRSFIDSEIVIFDAWTASRMRPTSYDPSSRLLRLSGKFAGHGVHHDMTAGLPYFIENYRDEPLAERSWQCDMREREIKYRPASNDAFPTDEIVVPRLSKLISIEGGKTQSVHDIHFEDLYFSTTAWHLPDEGWAAMQAEVGLPGAIEIQNANAIKFSRFALVHTGATGIRIRENCFDIEVNEGELRDLGGTGIAIGSEQRRPAVGTPWSEGETSSSRTHDVRILNNLIASVGRIHFAAVGVWIGQADHVLVERNEIRDLYYTGISVGWTWEYGPSLSHDNRIIGNVVSNFGQGLLSDLGGIYTLGRQANSLVEGNFISKGKARTYGGHGIYADAGTAGFTFRNNVVTNVSHAGIHIHYGTDLLFERNYLLDYGEAAVRCTRPSKGSSVVFRNNVLSSNRAAPYFGVCTDRSYVFGNNDIITASPPHGSDLPIKIQEAVEEIHARAGRSSPIRLTGDIQDGPSIVP